MCSPAFTFNLPLRVMLSPEHLHKIEKFIFHGHTDNKVVHLLFTQPVFGVIAQCILLSLLKINLH